MFVDDRLRVTLILVLFGVACACSYSDRRGECGSAGREGSTQSKRAKNVLLASFLNLMAYVDSLCFFFWSVSVWLFQCAEQRACIVNDGSVSVRCVSVGCVVCVAVSAMIS